MRLDCEARVRGGVTLVEVRLANETGERRRVRVANRLDGDVWFPRSRGHAAPGWDDGGYEGVLDAGETRALGYACPATPAPESEEAPAVVAWSERAADAAERRQNVSDGGGETDSVDGEQTPASVVQQMGDPRPPRHVLPDAAVDLPEAVADWLAAVDAEIADDTLGRRETRQLAAVATRVRSLRREVEGP